MAPTTLITKRTVKVAIPTIKLNMLILFRIVTSRYNSPFRLIAPCSTSSTRPFLALANARIFGGVALAGRENWYECFGSDEWQIKFHY